MTQENGGPGAAGTPSVGSTALAEEEPAPRTTAVLPPQGGGGKPVTGTAAPEPGGRPPRRGSRAWLLVLAVVIVVAIIAAAAWLMRGSLETPSAVPIPPTTITSPTPSVEPVVPTETPTVASAAVPATKAASPTTTQVDPALVTDMSWSMATGYRITVDYVQILHGKAAAAAATAHHDESPPPDGYYIVNDSPAPRTFTVPPSADITVLGWNGADATARHTLTVQEFAAIMPGGGTPRDPWNSAYYEVTVKNGATVTAIAQIFFP